MTSDCSRGGKYNSHVLAAGKKSRIGWTVEAITKTSDNFFTNMRGWLKLAKKNKAHISLYSYLMKIVA
jgi:hypothetical protein